MKNTLLAPFYSVPKLTRHSDSIAESDSRRGSQFIYHSGGVLCCRGVVHGRMIWSKFTFFKKIHPLYLGEDIHE